MKTVTLVEAYEQLESLLGMVTAGEEITITVDGMPKATLVAPYPLVQQLPSLAEFRAGLPLQTESAGEFMRRIRDLERY